MKISLQLMDNHAEIIQSYLPYINIGIQHNHLSYFEEKKALCHWHNDIELIKIISGEMNFYVNGHVIQLKERDGLIINAKAMHYGYAIDDQDCQFICVLINPNIFNEETLLYQKFIAPIINTPYLNFSYLSFNKKSHLNLLNIIDNFNIFKNEYLSDKRLIDFQCVALASIFWENWFDLVKSQINDLNNDEPKEVKIQKKMINFIQQNYMNPITLENIARSANIGRNKCCILFDKYTQQSPIKFVTHYRIEKAKELFCQANFSVTEVAYCCGFNNLSYFSKQFYKLTGCLPSQYKKTKISFAKKILL
ncbi:AraC family transcriptional regulator [Avibacterium sp. 21-586]|uniref:AraC family transcriptional regulator n=1 Tax=Avibacterium sp. 21-586 TaxID=2911534 RepID=UPI00224754D7|nr:AraC family transcriptional regulator [Avibacterium sp. 21-586]MCW9710650.1 AraC family transcriptional regulator [Avibacterium sp. 21-586]